MHRRDPRHRRGLHRRHPRHRGAVGGLVRLVDNPKVTAAAAMNAGIAAAGNEVIVRADAHTIYASDYVTASVASLEGTDAAVVGGAMRPSACHPFGRAVAAVTSSPFGIGPGRFHYSDELGRGRHGVPRGLPSTDRPRCRRVRRREHPMGGRRSGAELQDQAARRPDRARSVDPLPVLPPPDGALVRQYHNYGLCKASTLAKHKTLPYWRPVAPGLGRRDAWAGLLSRCSPPAVVGDPTACSPTAYGAAAVAGRLSRERGVAPHRAPCALTICHWCYGAGLWRGVDRIVTGRPFDNRPRPKR